MQCPLCQQELTSVGKFWICSEHGQIGPETNSASVMAVQPQRVFISYGRADALKFAQRLAADLQRRGGHHVWLDLEGIEKGGLFEVGIERGIRESSVVAAVMTKHSLREESICRDEVVFALNEGKKVVPLRTDPDPLLKPTLLLARRNWIDFTENYEDGLATLLSYLSGDESTLREPMLPTVTGVAPLDFSVEIARFSSGFSGRQWLTGELDRWLATDTRRAFVIVAPPGVGKSSIAAWLSLTRQDVVGVHFCTQQNTRSRDPYEFVACLVGQLHARLPGFAEAVQAKHPELRRATAADAFRELIVEPARNLAHASDPRLIIIDSLDEAATHENETVLDVLVRQAPDLPFWLRVVATTRPEESILKRIKNLSVFELQADRSENRADLRGFISARLATPTLASVAGPDTHSVALRIESLAEGNFLYARLALDALEEGILAVGDLGRLTPGLAVFYTEAFSRRFRDIERYERDYAPLLRALGAARAPLSFKLLQRRPRVGFSFAKVRAGARSLQLGERPNGLSVGLLFGVAQRAVGEESTRGAEETKARCAERQRI
jgi:hypothetical protein